MNVLMIISDIVIITRFLLLKKTRLLVVKQWDRRKDVDVNRELQPICKRWVL